MRYLHGDAVQTAVLLEQYGAVDRHDLKVRQCLLEDALRLAVGAAPVDGEQERTVNEEKVRIGSWYEAVRLIV